MNDFQLHPLIILGMYCVYLDPTSTHFDPSSPHVSNISKNKVINVVDDIEESNDDTESEVSLNDAEEISSSFQHDEQECNKSLPKHNNFKEMLKEVFHTKSNDKNYGEEAILGSCMSDLHNCILENKRLPVFEEV